jgi:N-acetyl-beta-hexosaminidase
VPHLTHRWGIPEILDWNIYNWQNWWEESYATLHPINVEPTEQVIGAQLCVWEGTFEQSIGRAMENLAALSERTWSHTRRSDTDTFLDRLAHPLSRIAALIKA